MSLATADATPPLWRRLAEQQQPRRDRVPKRYRPQWYDQVLMLPWRIISPTLGVWIIGFLYFALTQIRYVFDAGDFPFLHCYWGPDALAHPGHTLLYLKPHWNELPMYFGFA